MVSIIGEKVQNLVGINWKLSEKRLFEKYPFCIKIVLL